MCGGVSWKCSSRNDADPVGANDTRYAEELHARRTSRHDDFGDGAAESAAHRVFFDRQDGAAGGGSLDRRIVERPNGGHVDHRRVHTFGFEQRSRLEGAADHDPVGDEREIGPRAEAGWAADLEAVGIRVDDGHRQAAETKEDRPVERGDRANGLRRFDRVCRHDDRHAGNRPRPRDVFDGVMRGTELAVRHAARHPTELDIVPAVGEIDLDLFERPPRQEAGSRAGERNLPGGGEPRAHAHHVLLRDADVDQPLGEPGAELLEIGRADRVVDDGDDSRIPLGQGDESVSERRAAIEQGTHESPRSSTDASISARARASSSSVGTRWCHSTLSAMNDTPWPL